MSPRGLRLIRNLRASWDRACAIAARGALVSFVESSGEEGGVLTTYESFDELRDNVKKVPENFMSGVAAASGVDHVEELDI